LLYSLFEGSELYERNLNEWYNALLAKSYPHIVSEEVRDGRNLKQRLDS